MEKLYFTKKELIEITKKLKPKLKGEDLEQCALGGHVKTEKGYIWFPDWEVVNSNKKKRRTK